MTLEVAENQLEIAQSALLCDIRCPYTRAHRRNCVAEYLAAYEDRRRLREIAAVAREVARDESIKAAMAACVEKRGA